MARICYIGNFTRIYDEEGIARSLEKLGHEVIRIAEQGYHSASIQVIVNEKPDFVLFAKLKIPMVWREGFFDAMKKYHIKTVCWIPDLFFGLGRERYIKSSDSFFRADVVLTPDGGHDKKWKELGINHKLLRQGIYDEDCETGATYPVEHSIAFVGTQNGEFPYRQKLMMELAQHYGKMFRWFGRMSANHIRGKELTSMLQSTPIIIGDSVYSPHYWSNRVYETIGRGGFLIHPNIPGLEEEFSYYKHFIPYDYGDFGGLFEKIDYYLQHPDERRKITEAGRKHVMENHTLLHRCKRLLELV